MNLILVSIGNFQDYIIDNIKQLIRLGIVNIFVITNKDFFEYFEIYKNNIVLVDVNELNDNYNYYNKSNLDKSFRNGFWTLTSLRFFYIYALIEKYNLVDCIHIENDVLLYYNINVLEKHLNKNCLYIPFDTYKRNIASIMYIPNHYTFKNILDVYDFNKNDMENFSHVKSTTNLIKNFPIFPTKYCTETEELFVSENFDLFNYMFDAAAIGQYLGGVDPRNAPGDTRGFVNETCVIKYNNYNIYFKELDSIKRPFITINNEEFPIFNLHIHSKTLRLYC
jgi:hypothetical protein